MVGSVFKRYEIKYLVDKKQRTLLENLFAEYMEPDAYGESTICNIYYDTPDYRMIRQSLQKPEYKEKIRLRSYGQVGEDDTVFLELKKKYDGVVYKRRISLPEYKAQHYLSNLRYTVEPPEDSQIGRELDYACHFYQNLMPAMYICYDRCAYFSKEDPNFRVTFDQNICWRTQELSLELPSGGTQILKPGQSLMEVKTATSIPMWLVKTLSKENIYQVSFSKYGRAYTSVQQAQELEGGVYCA